MSGKKVIALGPGVSEAFKEMRKVTQSEGYKYVIYKVTGENGIELDAKDPSGTATWEQFTAKLPRNEGRYAIVDFVLTRESDNVKLSKLIFVSWVPSGIKVKERMFYGMYAQEFKTQISEGQAIETFVQATDVDEITYDVVVDQIRRHSNVPSIAMSTLDINLFAKFCSLAAK